VTAAAAVGRDDDGHRFADEPHLVRTRRVVRHGRLQGQRERPQRGLHLVRADDGGDPGVRAGTVEVDGHDACVRVRAAHHRRVQRPGQRAEIVEERPSTGEQGGVLDACERPTDEPVGRRRVLTHSVASPGSVAFTMPYG
jgi:hypothetical protein